MRFESVIALVLVLAGLTDVAPVFAQRTNPIAEDAIRLASIGDMIGTLRFPKRQFSREEFGASIWPLGDVNSDGLADWAVSRVRCDTIVLLPYDSTRGTYPEEVFLYKGVRGGLPMTESGVRLGPTEIGVETKLIAAGDFDADGSPDIVLSTRNRYDTVGGNPQGILPVHQL